MGGTPLVRGTGCVGDGGGVSGREVSDRCGVGLVGYACRDVVFDDEGNSEVRIANGGASRVGGRDAKGRGGSGRHRNGSRFVERQCWGRSRKEGTSRSKVGVEFLVVITGGDFLVGRGTGCGTRIQREKLVVDESDGSGVVGRDILKVEAVLERDEPLGAVVQLDHDNAVAFDEAKAERAVPAGISDGLHPRIAVGQEVSVVVEAGTDGSKVVPDPFGDEGTRDARVSGGRAPTEAGLDGVKVGGWHLGRGVRADLVGHGGDFVPHGDLCSQVGVVRRAVGHSGGPCIVVQPEVIGDDRCLSGHAAAQRVLLWIGNEEVLNGGSSRRERGDASDGVDGPARHDELEGTRVSAGARQAYGA